MNKKENIFIDYNINPSHAYKIMQKTCIKKCIEDLSTPSLNVA